jgi:hypothetical protein
MSSDSSQSHFDYNDRYGIRSQRAWLPYAISLLIVGGGWLIWAALHHAQPAISSQLLAFDNKDSRNIEIRYILTREDPSQSATCILTARDINKVIVGQVIDRIPAGSSPIERAVKIPSRADAVNAGIQSCYLD